MLAGMETCISSIIHKSLLLFPGLTMFLPQPIRQNRSFLALILFIPSPGSLLSRIVASGRLHGYPIFFSNSIFFCLLIYCYDGSTASSPSNKVNLSNCFIFLPSLPILPSMLDLNPPCFFTIGDKYTLCSIMES